MSDVDQFLTKAKESVAKSERLYFDQQYSLSSEDALTPDEIYIVWFCKVLGNWKALLSTDVFDSQYWEVTYNGAKQETYVDTYVKARNVCLPDGA